MAGQESNGGIAIPGWGVKVFSAVQAAVIAIAALVWKQQTDTNNLLMEVRDQVIVLNTQMATTSKLDERITQDRTSIQDISARITRIEAKIEAAENLRDQQSNRLRQKPE